MSEFDAYHRWLGIPPAEQPANLYRLLAVQLFESDPDVIEAAADRQMAYVQQCATGPHVDASQELLNELSQARVTLLNPEKKAAYDAELRRQTGATVKRTERADQGDAFWIASAPGRPAARRRRPDRNVVFVASGLVGLGILAVLVWAFPGGDSPHTAGDGAAKRVTTAAVDRPSNRDADPASLPDEKNDLPAKSGGGDQTVVDTSGREVNPFDADVTVAPTPTETVEQQPKPSEGSTAPTPAERPKAETTTKVAAAGKAASEDAPKAETGTPPTSSTAEAPGPLVPGVDEQRKMLKVIEGLFKDDFAKAKLPAGKIALAKKLLEQAQQTPGQGADRYVLLQLARDLAAEAGDVETALQAVDGMVRTYHVNANEAQADAYLQAVKSARSPEQLQAVAAHVFPLVDVAISADDYKTADRLIKAAQSVARKTRHRELLKRLADRSREIEQIERAGRKLQGARATLEQNPIDPDANLQLGRYLCLMKGDWGKGLSMLAAGSDPQLQQMALKELGGAATEEEELALADGWWDVAGGQTGLARKHVRLFAAARYKQVAPKLSGLKKVKAEKRLAEMDGPVPHLHELLPSLSPDNHYGDKKILLILHKDELDLGKQDCEKYGLKFDVATSFDMHKTDYSDYHTILGGTNSMDYWGKSDEHKKPEAFRHIEAFVEAGGHLLVLGSWNGRNWEHLRRFGVKTSYFHNGFFEPAGRPTELLFEGNLHIIPQDRRMLSTGDITFSVPHTALLKRGKGYKSNLPALATLKYRQGRLTVTMAEPAYKKEYWLITVLLSWIARGCPT